MTQRLPLRIATATTVALLAAGALAACAGADAPDGSGSASPSATAAATPDGSGTTGPSPVSADLTAVSAAIDAALAAVPGAVVELEDQREGGGGNWEVLIRAADGSGTEATVDRSSLRVLSTRADDLPEEARAGAPAIDASAALRAADAHRGGLDFRSLELDDSRGRVVWEVEAADTTGAVVRTVVDATTGDILP